MSSVESLKTLMKCHLYLSNLTKRGWVGSTNSQKIIFSANFAVFLRLYASRKKIWIIKKKKRQNLTKFWLFLWVSSSPLLVRLDKYKWHFIKVFGDLDTNQLLTCIWHWFTYKGLLFNFFTSRKSSPFQYLLLSSYRKKCKQGLSASIKNTIYFYLLKTEEKLDDLENNP